MAIVEYGFVNNGTAWLKIGRLPCLHFTIPKIPKHRWSDNFSPVHRGHGDIYFLVSFVGIFKCEFLKILNGPWQLGDSLGKALNLTICNDSEDSMSKFGWNADSAWCLWMNPHDKQTLEMIPESHEIPWTLQQHSDTFREAGSWTAKDGDWDNVRDDGTRAVNLSVLQALHDCECACTKHRR